MSEANATPNLQIVNSGENNPLPAPRPTPLLAAEARETNGADDVCKKINQIVARHEASQAQVARETGISAGVVSQVLAKTYDANPEKIEAKLKDWLANRTPNPPALVVDTSGFVLTQTAINIQTVLEYSLENHKIGVIYGGSGVGKTVTAEHFAATHPCTWVVPMSPQFERHTSCLKNVMLTLYPGEVVSGYGSDVISHMIVQRLGGQKGLLIIDEAQYLGFHAIEALRWVFDQTKCALVLMGSKTVYMKVMAGRVAEFAQIYSRIGATCSIEKPQKADSDALARKWGVNSQDALRFLRKTSSEHGALRQVEETLRLASTAAKGAGEEINLVHLKAAAAMRGGRAL